MGSDDHVPDPSARRGILSSPRSSALRRGSYYIAVFVADLLIHQGPVNDLLGPRVSDLLRRNNEAYILMLLLPAYWDLFAGQTDPNGGGGSATIEPSWKAQGSWFAAIASIALVLSFESLGKGLIGLPQSIITLRESFIALLVLCPYLGWSRRILPGPTHVIDGTAVATLRQRAIAYAVVVMAILAVWLDLARTIFGYAIGDWLALTTEALAAIVLIAIYFDVVAASRRRWIHLSWYLTLMIIPLVVQGGFVDELLPLRIGTWIGQATEAFIAAFFISVYFDVWRRPHGFSDLIGSDRSVSLRVR